MALDHLDPAVDPGADFYRHVNGRWLDTVEIPDRYSSYGAFTMIAEEADSKMKDAIELAASTNPAPGTLERKVVDFYQSYVDQAAIDARGLAPLNADFAAIDAIATIEDLGRAFGDPALLAESPLALTIRADERRPGQSAVYLSQAGLGMPTRDYYLEKRHAERQTAYEAHIANALALGGVVDSEAKAARVYALERDIAATHWEPEKSGQRELAYNPKSIVQLKAFAPEAPWDAMLAASGLQSATEIVVKEDDAVRRLALLVAQTPLETWKDYLKFHVIRRMSEVLPATIDAAEAAFQTQALGAPDQTIDRQRRTLKALDAGLGDASGRVYVDRHFPAASKRKATEIADAIALTLIERVDRATWMSGYARAEAKGKIQSLKMKIGYPDVWRDFGRLTIVAGDAYGNQKRVAAFDWNQQVERLGGTDDKKAWPVSASSVAAYYNPAANEIVVTAGFLQQPVFDPKADMAVNYGAIGALLAHEIVHAIDANGRRSDRNGVIRDWWTSKDAEEFGRRANRLGEQFANYEPLPGMAIDPALTMNETVADLAGLAIAHAAYRRSIGEALAPDLEGFTGDQRFFLAWAQVWKRAVRDEVVAAQLVADPHAPAQFRVNGTVRNLEAWSKAFEVGPGDPLYLTPGEAVAFW